MKKKQQKAKKQQETVKNYISGMAESSDRPKNTNESKKYICKFCGKEFENGNRLDDHLSMH